MNAPAHPDPPAIGRQHARRLREMYRSAGWPCQDDLEIELLAAGLLERLRDDQGRETLRVTDAGLQVVTRQMAIHRQALSQHEALVRLVAQQMARAGRISWCGLGLRAQVPGPTPGTLRWAVARPDVFSIRSTSVAEYVDPVVHEVKVRRADLLGDLRRPGKRAAYQDLGACWYVLGEDAKGRPIGDPDEVPAPCGVMLARGARLVVARAATAPARTALPFNVWMALARATPAAMADDQDSQGLLVEDEPPPS